MDVVPPSLLGLSIFIPVFSTNTPETNFIEFFMPEDDVTLPPS